MRLVATRQVVINNAFDIVDRALDLTGGAGAFQRSRLEQLFRDVRMGRFHPGNTLLAHELIGKLCLGIDPDAAPALGLTAREEEVHEAQQAIIDRRAVAALLCSVRPAAPPGATNWRTGRRSRRWRRSAAAWRRAARSDPTVRCT